MLVSYRWLRELLPGLTASPAEVAQALSGVGLTVDAVHRPGASLKPLLVAKVLEIQRHPKLDKVRLVTIDRGAGVRQAVVCGASNVPDPGGSVVLAPLGTHLPAAGFTIEPRKIGGVTSEGMLVSESEVGLAGDTKGIIVLSAELEAGTPFLDACPEADDTVLEIDVTPNRPDALGHVGVARDLAALYELAFAYPRAEEPQQFSERALSELVKVSVEDFERCPHYGAGAVLGVKLGPSPDFMRWRLHRLGVRPISNVVDVTNWLLLEYGQPLHAFDLRFVRGAEIVVRRAKGREPFTTLDGVERRLDPDDLVICDAEGPVALAGVMGGADSEIRGDTTDVLLECAYFSPRGVRRTARRHAMHTESSHRFERGTDWGGIERVLERAKALLVKYAQGTCVRGAIHAKGKPEAVPSIALRAQRLNALVGAEVPFQPALAALARLGFPLLKFDPDTQGGIATFAGASHRPDVSIEVDLIEEVARLRGLDAIPTVLPRVAPQPPKNAGALERETARIATELGLSEALTYAFVSERELLAVHAPPPVVRLSNPLSEERNVLRTSLLPGLLDALKRARRRGETNARLFSVGARYLPRAELTQSPAARVARPSQPDDAAALPLEQPSFAAVIAGVRAEYLSLKPAEVDVYDAKGIVVELVERLTQQRASVASLGATAVETAKHLHPRGAGTVSVGSVQVGTFGPIHPELIEALDLGGSALVIEVDLAALEAVGRKTPRFVSIPKLPAVTRDVSLVVHDDVIAGDVGALFRETAGELCESIELLAVFRGGSVPSEHQSLTFRLVYRDPKASQDAADARTLTDKEVDEQQERVIERAREKLGATLRG
jgi:phenylalanyl-tRNA synthetase beta chain